MCLAAFVAGGAESGRVRASGWPEAGGEPGVRLAVEEEREPIEGLSVAVMMRELLLRVSAGVVLVCALCVCGATNEEILSRVPSFPPFGNRERLLNARVVELVSKYHFSPKQLTPELSRQWYQE